MLRSNSEATAAAAEINKARGEHRMSALPGRCSRKFLAVALFVTLTAAIAFPIKAFAATDLGAVSGVRFEVKTPSLDAPAGGNYP
jgi:hypothetical protein